MVRKDKEMVSVHVSGLRELEQALNKLDLDIRKKAARDAGNEAMEPIRRQVAFRVPKDEGALKSSIRMTSTNAPSRLRKEKKGAILRTRISAGNTKRHKGGAYALQVEFGTADTPKQPFLLPSIQGNERTVFRRFKQSLTDSIARGVKKQFRRNKRKAR